MNKLFAGLVAAVLLWGNAAFGGDMTENKPMKIKLSFNQNEVIVRMADNAAVRQFLRMLPDDFEFIDFAGEEKISEFPRSVSLAGVPRGMIAAKGKMFIYAPWGNFGFFYQDHGSTIDNSLVELGEIESGLEYLAEAKGGFSARIVILQEEQSL